MTVKGGVMYRVIAMSLNVTKLKSVGMERPCDHAPWVIPKAST